MCSSRKYPYSPHRRDWNFLEVGGSVRPKNLKKCMKLNWNFQRGEGGGGGLRKNPFRGGGMDIFWNYTISVLVDQCLQFSKATIPLPSQIQSFHISVLADQQRRVDNQQPFHRLEHLKPTNRQLCYNPTSKHKFPRLNTAVYRLVFKTHFIH